MKTAPSELLEFRLAQISEAPILARMSRDYVERGHGWSWQAPRIARCIRQPESVVLCACDTQAEPARRVAGFAVMDFGQQRAHLSLLAVMPQQRRRGIAKALLGWLEKTALVAGIAEVTLEVRASNLGARRFYARAGFTEIMQIPGYYSGRETAHRLRKQLQEPFYDQR